MRLTVISDPALVNSNYRAYQPLQVLSRQGHEVLVNRRGGPRFRIASLLQSDAVLIHRYFGADIQQLVAQAHAAGIGVVWDNDDDISNVPRSTPHYQKFGGANRLRVTAELANTMRAADVVTTPSERLAGQFSAAGAADVRVLENYLPIEFGRAKPVKHDGITIVWLAGLEHSLDYQHLRLRDAFRRLLAAHSDLHVLSIGLGLGLPTDRYTHHKLVAFLDLAQTMAVGDIGVAPLADIPWNQARSNVKLKEYAAAGLPWLASPVGPYIGMGEKQGGRLVPDDGWHDALDDLIRNARTRNKLRSRAMKWAKGQAIDKHAHLWEAALRDASARARQRRLGGMSAVARPPRGPEPGRVWRRLDL